jgi:hypothetical protein
MTVYTSDSGTRMVGAHPRVSSQSDPLLSASAFAIFSRSRNAPCANIFPTTHALSPSLLRHLNNSVRTPAYSDNV